jgi:PAS domain S-box-containing protein
MLRLSSFGRRYLTLLRRSQPVGHVVVMNNAEFQLRGVGDPRLAVHATSRLPAWLWSIDGTRIWWANPIGAALFDARNSAVLAKKTFGPANPHRRQVIQLAGRLLPTGAIRLERLRGFGASLGSLMTCACSRLDFSDGGAGILVAATASTGRVMPLVERLQRLVEGVDAPVAAYARDGLFVGASDAARALASCQNVGFQNLSDAGLETARIDALTQGRLKTAIGIGRAVLQRVGSGADIGLVALIEPEPPVAETALPIPAASTPASPDHASDGQPADDEAATASSKAAATFALIDEFADPPAERAQAATPGVDLNEHEPSEFVEAVADEPSQSSAAETASASEPPAAASTAEPNGEATPPRCDQPPQPWRNPLRFIWQIDAEGRFWLGSEEFTRLIGPCTAAAFGRRWSGIAEVLGLDPEGLVSRAVATRDTWSGVTLSWPADGGARLPVELSGLPLYDHEHNFVGYRGFGVCRDLDGLTLLATLRHTECFNDPPSRASRSPTPLSADVARRAGIAAEPGAGPFVPEPIIRETSPPSEPDRVVEPPKNVLPFRPANDTKSPSLTQVENNTFNELTRQLETRLEAEKAIMGREPDPAESSPASSTSVSASSETPDAGLEPAAAPARDRSEPERPEWLSPPEPPAHGEMLRDKSLLDLLPVGVLIYRLDRLLYANRAFLDRIGYASLQALEQADGLDALFVEPVEPMGSSTSGTGAAVTIAAMAASTDHAPLPPTQARLFTISWDRESAMALICSNAPAEPAPVAATAVAVPEPSPAGQANAEELGAILDTATEGVVMFDAQGSIHSCNRSAEALFGYDGEDFMKRNLAELFAPESQRVLKEYLESIKGAGVASLLDHGRDMLGRVRGGGLVPLSMTMGRTRPNGANFFAVFRDLSQSRKNETELSQARRQAERAANAKADMLARISHEVRTPLNAIIGFAEVMIGERFGALGNERYVEYMKDIRASGERVIAIINDLTDLSRIETGKIELAFANQNLNELVESCVAVMQPQANRERIIIRTSLAHMLPTVVADARALRQITLNLIGNSIHLANAGGQVIVSTALSDFGEVVLRVRDTGHGLNDNELAAAMEPFRTQRPADQTADSAGITLSLTKALVEANRAQFQIKTAPQSGTLIEVIFSRAVARG